MKNNPLNNYAVEMAELNLSRNPVSTEVILVLCDQSRDHYRDAVSNENYRVKKKVIVKKETDLNYVQFNQFDMLMEDTKNLPWTVSMTIKDVKRYEYDEESCDDLLVDSIPHADDQILMDGRLYTISMVFPSNRFLDGIVNCLIYPERSSPEDPLAIYRVDKVVQPTYTVYSVVWGGAPTHYSFDGEEWIPFKSYIKVEGEIQPSVLYIKDKCGEEAEIEL